MGRPDVKGAKPPHAYENQQEMVFGVSRNNASATAGVVLGIAAMVFSIMSPFFFLICCIFSIPLAFLGIIFSHIGYFNAKKTGVGKSEAIAGLILNWPSFLLGLIPILSGLYPEFFS
ncbi:MAG: hypothetical protein GWO84_01620 [Euryarchaeota archaeon]|nr:hypothetical protein [Euryarchaeota archaeon]